MPHPTLHRLAGASLCLAAFFSGGATAAPVTASFDGTITSLRAGSVDRLISEFPVGTAVSATVNFDNSLPGVTLSQPPVIIAASGQLMFGTAIYAVNGIRASGRAVTGAPTVPDYWSFIIQATGLNTDDGDLFYGFYWFLNAALDGFRGAPPDYPLEAAWAQHTVATGGVGRFMRRTS